MELNIKMESKTYQYRKVTKPLLERKRRARINKCLDDLKDLMIDSMRQQGDNIARLEKADILELTVEHLKKIKQNKSIDEIKISSKSNNNDCFKSGYIHAANEVSKALATLPRVDIELGTKLMTHLGHRLNQIQNHEQQPQQQEVNRSVNSTTPQSQLRGITSPLSVYCDNATDNYYHSTTIMNSPSSSSGYGSDSEFSASLLSSPDQHLQVKELWRPW